MNYMLKSSQIDANKPATSEIALCNVYLGSDRYVHDRSICIIDSSSHCVAPCKIVEHIFGNKDEQCDFF